MNSDKSRDLGSIEQHIAQLAVILEQHSLTHLEYDADGSRVVLDKRPPKHYHGAHQQMLTPHPLDAAAASVADPVTSEVGIVGTAVGAAAGTPVTTIGQSNKATTSAPTTAAATETDGKLITAPLVGICYASKEPGAVPFVKENDMVSKGDVLCLIEAMKMFNEVKASVAGKITKIHFEDGLLVEYGAPLFSIK